ncbi:TnsA endonuclease N-terminal domain-containing protein [Pseudoxanthomonas mexicana]
MARRRYSFDETKLKRFAKEGRGTGHGSDYRPWLQVQDVPSHGRSTRIHSYKTGRQHHLLSDLETGLFLILDWADHVVDIREQFPLDRDVTRMLAAKMGVVHPRDVQTKSDIVMTTDLLVDVRLDGGVSLIALSVKPASKLEGARTLEKLELERRFWARINVPWYLVTERELHAVRIGNLRWLHEMRSLDELKTPHADYWPDRCNRFLGELSRVRGGLIEDFLKHLQQNCEFGAGEAMTVLRHLAANKRIRLDLNREFSAKDRFDAIEIVERNVSKRMSA